MTSLLLGLILAVFACSCAGGQETAVKKSAPVATPPPKGPDRLVLVAEPIDFQDQAEPFKLEAVFSFDLPRPPRRARLLLRYSGVPGATSEDYTMGRFRHRVELNKAFLMDLNTFAQSEEQIVSHRKWISVGMFRRHNQLKFSAGDDGKREQSPDHDEFQLRSVVLEFDW